MSSAGTCDENCAKGCDSIVIYGEEGAQWYVLPAEYGDDVHSAVIQ